MRRGMRALTMLAAGAAVATAASAADRLTVAGAALPPVAYAPGAPLEIAVDAGGDTVLSAHVVLRPHSSSLALARDRDGFWAPWNGDPATLPDTAVTREDGRLVFKIFAAPPRSLTPPLRVTLAYRTPEGLRHGAFTATPEARP